MLVQVLTLLAVVAAWTASEIEIFRLNDAVAKDLNDAKATFYTWLGVKPNSNVKVITKAFRKLSQAIHPDKNPSPGAQERFSRLGLVHKILRSQNRDTYDFYLKHGFPKLNSSGEYVFKRWKPSFLVTIVLVVLLGAGIQYAILKANTYRKKQFIQGIINEAYDAAAVNGVVSSKRAVKLPIGKEAIVHPDGSVYVDNDKISPELIPEPTLKDTFLLKWLQ